MPTRLLHILFWLCLLAEPLLLTVWAGRTGRMVSPALWLVVALIPAAITLWWQPLRRVVAPTKNTIKQDHTALIWSIFTAGLLLCAVTLATIIGQFEVSPHNSDILPSLKLYAERFLAGTDPYAPMEFPGWTVMPNYFTLRWLPFVPAAMFKFDYRWIGFIALAAAFLYYTIKITAGQPEPIATSRFGVFSYRLRQIFLPVAAPWLLLFVFMHFDRYAFGNAVETLIAAYYLVLAFTLFRSPSAMAFGIVLCLRSRISFTFWLPMYGMLILLHMGWRTALRTGLYVAGAVLLLFVLPYIVPDSGKMFLDGLKYYDVCASNEWQRQSWQEEGAIPTHLSRGIGFAYYWYQYGAEAVQYAACQRTFQIICLLTAALLFLGWWLRRKKAIDMVLYGVVSLKVYMTVFYGFFPIPYHYLYLTPCLLSLGLVWVQMRRV